MFNRGIFVIVVAMTALLLFSYAQDISAHAKSDSQLNAAVCSFTKYKD